MRKVRVYKDAKKKEILYQQGLFHGWSQEFEEFETGTGNYPVAIIELEDGSIITPYVCLVQFID